MKSAGIVACLLALVATGCSNSNNTQSTTAPTTTVAAPTTQTDFTGTLTVGATLLSVPFTVAAAGNAAIDLESVTLTLGGPATTIQIGIGLAQATPDASGALVCGAQTKQATVAPALTAQLTAPVAVGSYCAAVYDPGTLKVPVIFLVRIIHP